MSGIKTTVTQSNFANGVTSPRLTWTTNEELFRSTAEEIVNAHVGDFGELERRKGMVSAVAGSVLSSAGSRVYGFTVQDKETGDVRRLILCQHPGGEFYVYDSDAPYTESTYLLSHEDMRNTMSYFATTRTVYEEREEDPEASKYKEAKLFDENTGTYEWTYSRVLSPDDLTGYSGKYWTQKSTDGAEAGTIGSQLRAGTKLGFIDNYRSEVAKKWANATQWYYEYSYLVSGYFEAAYTVTEEDVENESKFYYKIDAPSGWIFVDTRFEEGKSTDEVYAGNVRWTRYALPLEHYYTLKIQLCKEVGGEETVLAVRTFTKIPDMEGMKEIITVRKQLGPESGAKLTTMRKLRHANYGGEEFFCGRGQAPFKISLDGGKLSAGILTYKVPPFNDTVVGSEYKIHFKKSGDFGIVKLPESLRISRYDWLKLINYDAQSLCRMKLKCKDGGKAEDGQAAGWTSDILPAYGNVTLRTEGSYWAGTLVLYERMLLEDGSTEDVDLGQIVAGGLTATTTLPATVTRLNSQVYVKLTEFWDAVKYMEMNGGEKPSDSYKDDGVTVSLQVSGTQEVFCEPYYGTIPDDVMNDYPEAEDGYKILVFKCKTTVTGGSFKTNSFATSILRTGFADYPYTLCFFQDRLVFGGTNANPKIIYMSKTGDPTNFQLGTNDDEAVSTVVSGSDLEEIRWLCPREALLVGTSHREYSLRGSNTAAVTPTSIKVSKPSGEGAWSSADMDCRNIESGAIAIRGNREEVLSYAYTTDSYTYQPTVMNALSKDVLAEHGGIQELEVVVRPESEIWLLLGDGTLAHVRLSEGIKNGWSLMDFRDTLGIAKTLFVNREEDRDVLGVGFISNEGVALVRIAYFYDDAQYYASRSDAAKKAVSTIDPFPYMDSFAGSDGGMAFETRVKLRPWASQGVDAWGVRAVPVKTALCLCEARGFETSLDGGDTWHEENVRYGADGNRSEILYKEYELRGQGKWGDTAQLLIRTTDNHSFVLSAVRTRLTTGTT